MATISARNRKDGSTGYTATIRIKRGGAIIHQESKTFDKKRLAQQWAKNRESLLHDPNEMKKALHHGVTVGEVLKCYQDEFGALRQSGRSKDAELKRLQRAEIAGIDAIHLTSSDLISHLMDRLSHDGVKPQTANNDLVWIRVAFKSVRASKGWPLAIDEVENAVTIAKSQRLVARSSSRDRRPTCDELDKLDKYFSSRDRRSIIPMRDIMWFAIFSARRQSEITRLCWDDNDDQNTTGLVRDLKHPREKEGNHRRFKYPLKAWEILQKQPRNHTEIFPFNPKSIGAAFTKACKVLEINDLRFHDLRHEATSRLFEAGNSIQNVQLVTLHESWDLLKRYTHLKPESVTLKE